MICITKEEWEELQAEVLKLKANVLFLEYIRNDLIEMAEKSVFAFKVKGKKAEWEIVRQKINGEVENAKRRYNTGHAI
jgi:hypothetical protein